MSLNVHPICVLARLHADSFMYLNPKKSKTKLILFLNSYWPILFFSYYININQSLGMTGQTHQVSIFYKSGGHCFLVWLPESCLGVDLNVRVYT